MEHNKTYGGLDTFRLIAVFLVVANHTAPLETFSPEADFFLTRILARLAVPFFFMVTGQFVVARYLTDTNRNFHSVWGYIKKILLLYGFAILIYLPVGIYAGFYQKMTVLRAFKMFFFDGPFYHLWYFPALLIGLLLVCLMLRFFSFRSCMILSAVLYLVGLFGDSYWGVTMHFPAAASVYEACFQLFSYTRNGLFFTPLFLLLGAQAGGISSQDKKRHKNILHLSGLFFSFLLMTAEGLILHHFHLQRHDSMYLALPVCSIFLYRALLKWNRKPSNRIRTISTWIYILHPAVIVMLRFLAKLSNAVKFLIANCLANYIAVCLLSFLAAGSLPVLISGLRHQSLHAPANTASATGRAWITLDRSALHSNVSVLKKLLPDECVLMPVLKANAYGHGALPMAKELNQMGIYTFCVACVSEGVQLRKSGITGEILILGYTHPDQFVLLCKYHLTQTIVDYEYANELNRFGKKIRVHIAIDTGMHRLGEYAGHTEQIYKIFEMKNLIIVSAYTHLCTCDTQDPADQAFVKKQVQLFYNLIDELKCHGFPCPKTHLQSSYGLLNYPQISGNYARVGIALYGMKSSREDYCFSDIHLQPVLSLYCRIASIKELAQDEGAGYSLAFTAKRPTKIAILTIGYADGLPRELSCGVGSVLINGHRAHIVGRICMDQTMADITDIPDVNAGDIAVIIGKSGKEEITAYDLAEQTGTITNEILSRLGARLERIMV